ncbi:unnamed protein product [Prunus brigantina]
MDKCRPDIESAVFLESLKEFLWKNSWHYRLGKPELEVLGILSKFHGGILVNIGRGLNVDEPESLHCWMVSAEMDSPSPMILRIEQVEFLSSNVKQKQKKTKKKLGFLHCVVGLFLGRIISLIESTGGAKEWGCWVQKDGGDAKSSSMKRVLVDSFGVRLNGK